MSPSAPRKRVAALISGRGSNMASLVEAARDPTYPADIALVISNRPDAAGVARARAAGIATEVIDHKLFANREAFDAAVHAALVAARIDLIALCGFMRIQTTGFVTLWLGRQINIHPSLLPAFKGLHPQQQALDAGVRISGASVHFVTPELDAGPIIAQGAVPVAPDDMADSLAARILATEHVLYPFALRMVADGTARLENGRCVSATRVNQRDVLLSPQCSIAR